MNIISFIKGNKIISFSFLIVLFYSLWLLIPPVQVYLGAKFSIILALSFFVTILFDREFLLTNYKKLLLLLLISFYLTTQLTVIYTVGIKEFIILFPQNFMLFFPFFAFYYLYNKKAYIFLNLTSYIVMLIMFIVILLNVYLLYYSPNAARTLGYGTADRYYQEKLLKFGFASFGFIYSIPILFFASLVNIFSNKKVLLKLFYILFSIAIVLFSIETKYLIILLLILFTTIIFILDKILFLLCKLSNKRYIFLYTLLILILISIVFVLFGYNILTYLENFFISQNNTSFANKISAIKTYLYFFDINKIDGTRLYDYYNGFVTIIKSPLIGIRLTDTLTISRHSTFIDLFADSGIPLGIIFFIFTYLFFKFLNYNIYNAKRHIYISFIILFLIFSTNVIIYSRESFLIFACLPYLIERR